MRTKLFFLILLLVLSSCPEVKASSGYGEDSESLGQFVDDYENDNNVSVAYNVVNNATLECMELNETQGVIWSDVRLSDYFESFYTGWTRGQGGGGTITKSSLQAWNGTYSARVYAPSTSSYCYCYRNFVQLNGDVMLTIHLYVDSSVQPFFENVIGLHDPVGGGYLLKTKLDYHDGGYYIQNDVNHVGTDVVEVNAGEWYDLVMYFDDTSDKITYYVNGVNEGEFTPNDATKNPSRVYIGDVSAADWNGYYYLDDLFIGIGEYGSLFEADGYFTTEDYLNYTDGASLSLMTNVSLPTGTELTVQFSSDNVTWVNNQGVEGYNSTSEGFMTFDLRDLNYSDIFMRYNFTTGSRLFSPRLYQSRLITTEGEAGAGAVTVTVESDAPWIALAIILSIIAFLLATRIKR